MNIAYFPFTSISENIAAAAYRYFGRFAVYAPVSGQETQPVRTLADENRIDVRCPILEEEALVMDLCRSFRRWGAVHQGRAAGLKQFAESGFYNDQFAAEIRSEILKGDEDLAQRLPDPILNARVFLQLAQEFDLQESEIESQLAATDTATKHLFDELKGEGFNTDERANPFAGVPDGTGGFMTETRMTAWCLLAGMDENAPDAFLTGSQVIVDLLSERFPSLAHVGEVMAVADTGANDFPVAEQIGRLARAPWEGPETMQAEFDFLENAGPADFRIILYVIPDLSPSAMIRSFADLPSGALLPATDARHSFICLMSPRK